MIEKVTRRGDGEDLTYSSDNIPYRKLWEALSWASDIGCVTLDGLGELVRRGKTADLIASSERFYEGELAAAAQIILEHRAGLRLVIIAGPSSSGKTTTTLKIREKLAEAGMDTLPLPADHYFFDLERHPKVGADDYDFETPQALDLELINAHLETLLSGGMVDVPRYSFRNGRREGTSAAVKLGRDQVLLVDSLHGLFPGMTESVPEGMKARLYVETLSVLKDSERRFIRWADIRMLRRMVRDMQFRNYSPRDTVRHWHLVRRAELKFIVPELTNAHAIVNSFLPYELPILKRRVESWLAPLADEFGRDPDRSDALERILRVRDMLAQVPAVDDESIVPEGSLLREFIGGSRLGY
jgi:uridine kinase